MMTPPQPMIIQEDILSSFLFHMNVPENRCAAVPADERHDCLRFIERLTVPHFHVVASICICISIFPSSTQDDRWTRHSKQTQEAPSAVHSLPPATSTSAQAILGGKSANYLQWISLEVLLHLWGMLTFSCWNISSIRSVWINAKPSNLSHPFCYLQLAISVDVTDLRALNSRHSATKWPTAEWNLHMRCSLWSMICLPVQTNFISGFFFFFWSGDQE